jgi:mycothiol synthase
VSQLRPARPDDLAAVHRLVRRVEIADHIPIVTPAEELDEWRTDPHFSFADDSRVVDGGDDQLAAYGRVWHRPSDSLQARVFLLGAVDPAHRRRGIGSALFAWQLGRARAILRAQPRDLRAFIRTQAYDFEDSALALYERHGLVPVRYVDELMRPLDRVDPPPSVDGATLAPWDPSRCEELRQVYNEGFSGEGGATPLDRDAWAHRMTAFGMRFDLSWIALRAGEVVAFSLNAHFPGDQAVTGRRDGWIRSLATRRAERRRGLGTALLLASCHGFRTAGFSHAMLGVDSDNPSEAYRLYQRVGFRRLHRSIQHQLEVEPGEGAP